MSLEKYHRVGILPREIEPYNMLAKHFNRIYFFSYGGENDLKFKNYFAPNIEIIINKKNTSSRYYKYFFPFLNRDILKKCHFLKTNQMKGAEAALLAKFINKKIKIIARTGYTYSLFAQQQGIYNKKIYFLEKVVYKICNMAIVTSNADKDYISSKYNLPKDKVTVIHNSINTEIFKPANKTLKYNDRIIFIGRLTEQKNLFNLVNALEDSNITLDVIGDGPLKPKLIESAQKVNVKINFLGNVQNDQIPNVLNRYRIFVLPSLYEGMPKTLLEAMSCQLAAIGTNVAGINEVITDNKTGLLTEIEPTKLKFSIMKLFANEELQKQLGQAARQFIINDYSLAKNIERELNIYEKMVK